MTRETPFTWEPFLRDWSGEWADSLTDDATRPPADESARRDRFGWFPN
ncbi:hypothetical protein [Streptomyces californicus]